jgi:peroxiredoxin
MLSILFDHSVRQSTAPTFRLPTPSGEMVALNDYYEEGSLVLVFIPQDPTAGDRASLRGISDQLKNIEAENSRLLGIFTQPREDLDPNQNSAFPLLVDADGQLRSSFTKLVAPGLIGDENIFLFILDAYGAPYVCLVGQETGEDFADELLSWLLYISIQCPE